AGSEKTVGRLDRHTLMTYWQRNYSPERLVVAAGGDVEHEDVVALTERFFGDLSVGNDLDTFTPATVTQDKPRVRLINRQTEQSHLCLSFPALSYFDERRFVQSTIEAVLSSGMSSRLFQEI